MIVISLQALPIPRIRTKVPARAQDINLGQCSHCGAFDPKFDALGH